MRKFNFVPLTTSEALRQIQKIQAPRVAWVEDIITLNLNSVREFQLSSSTFTFFESGPASEWVLNEILSSGLFPVVVYVPARQLTDVEAIELIQKFKLRRLHLLVIGSQFMRAAVNSIARTNSSETEKTIHYSSAI